MEVGWTLIPRGKKGSVPTLDAMTIGLFNTSKNKTEAANFLKFMCSTKGQLILFGTQKYIPTTFSALKNSKVQKTFNAKFLRNFQGGRASDLKREARQIENMMWNDVRGIAAGELQMSDFLENAKGQASDVLSMANYDF
jgi:ABC-type glycerol-3-phosphate transport system substrate-binding protein